MATGHDLISVTKTFTGTTADTITLDQFWPFVQVTNHDGINTVYVRMDGTAAPTAAVAAGAGCIPILPLQTRVLQALPIQSGSTIVISCVGNGGTYTVAGCNAEMAAIANLDSRYTLASTAIPVGGATAATFRSGRWTTVPHISRTTLVMTDQRLCLYPIRVARTRTINGVGIEITAAAASSLIRVGLYADDSTFNFPGSLANIDTGIPTVTIDSATGGTGFLSSACSIILTPGLWWIGVAAQGGAPTVRASATLSDLLSNTTGAGTAPIAFYLQESVSGAFPPTPTVGSGGSTAPLVHLKMA